MIRAALCALLLASPALASTSEHHPALYKVVDVDQGDVLNVRAEPNTNAPIIGTLSPLAANIEVVAVNDDATWGLLNTGEASGWASLRYLQRHDGQLDGGFPQITACFGTEPFWDIRFDAGRMSYADPAMARRFWDDVWTSFGANRIDRFAFGAEGMTATLRAEQCNDGMSDRAFGLTVDVVIEADGLRTLQSGCCTIQP